eukprot:3014052-Alexandrium_andersonii.AAC.1
MNRWRRRVPTFRGGVQRARVKEPPTFAVSVGDGGDHYGRSGVVEALVARWGPLFKSARIGS